MYILLTGTRSASPDPLYGSDRRVSYDFKMEWNDKHRGSQTAPSNSDHLWCM